MKREWREGASDRLEGTPALRFILKVLIVLVDKLRSPDYGVNTQAHFQGKQHGRQAREPETPFLSLPLRTARA